MPVEVSILRYAKLRSGVFFWPDWQIPMVADCCRGIVLGGEEVWRAVLRVTGEHDASVLEVLPSINYVGAYTNLGNNRRPPMPAVPASVQVAAGRCLVEYADTTTDRIIERRPIPHQHWVLDSRHWPAGAGSRIAHAPLLPTRKTVPRVSGTSGSRLEVRRLRKRARFLMPEIMYSEGPAGTFHRNAISRSIPHRLIGQPAP